MKKIKFQKKLSLNKETITKLNNDQMDQARGGTFVPSNWCTVWKCGPYALKHELK